MSVGECQRVALARALAAGPDVATIPYNVVFCRNLFIYLNDVARARLADWLASLAYKSDGYYNAANLPRPDIDDLVEKGASLYELQERKAVYHELNAKILDEAWQVPILYGVNYAAAPRKVRNLDRLMGWDGKMNLKRIWLSE